MSVDSSANIRMVLTQRCAGLGIPVSGNFELTPRCNLRCRMCYVRLTPEQMAPLGRELTAEQWLALGRQAVDAGMAFLLLTGGEPTLRRDFPEIYAGLTAMGLSISINTNGTLLTDQIRALWHRLPPAQVNVTLYGTCREDYEALCGDGSAFDRVVEGLDWLKGEGILTHLNTTIVPTNVHHWQELERFAADREMELRMTTYCFPPVRRAQCDSFTRLSPEQTAELTVADILCREGPEALRRRARSLSAPPGPVCATEDGEGIRCTAGSGQFWVSWNGKMTPCGMLTEPVAMPMDQGFAAAWETLKEQTAAIRLCPDCSACEERQTCMRCAAVSFAETGRFDGKPEYMCRLNRAYRAALENYRQDR